MLGGLIREKAGVRPSGEEYAAGRKAGITGEPDGTLSASGERKIKGRFRIFGVMYFIFCFALSKLSVYNNPALCVNADVSLTALTSSQWFFWGLQRHVSLA